MLAYFLGPLHHPLGDAMGVMAKNRGGTMVVLIICRGVKSWEKDIVLSCRV